METLSRDSLGICGVSLLIILYVKTQFILLGIHHVS
jgi:hypothetical protein